MKKRVLAWALALVLTLGLFPVSALAAGETVTVQATLQQAGSFAVMERELAVQAGLAKHYGYSNGASLPEGAVTALDVLVAIHVAVLDEDAAAVQEALKVSSSGFITEIMGEDAMASSFAVNGVQPTDGVVAPAYNSYTSMTAVEATVEEGDRVDFFFYQDTVGYSDLYAGFELAGGKKVHAVTAAVNEEISLTLKGYNYAYYGAYAPAMQDSMTSPVKGAQLALVEESGAVTDITSKVTGEDGSVAISFDQAGEYLLTAHRAMSGSVAPIILPLCQVSVLGTVAPADLVAAAKENLTWPTVRGNSGPMGAVVENFTLPQSSYPGTTVTWSAVASDFECFSLYGNAAYVTRPAAKAEDCTATLTATIQDDGKTVSDTRTFQIVIPAEPYNESVVTVTSLKALMDGIAEIYKGVNADEAIQTSDLAWATMDIAAYGAELNILAKRQYETARDALASSSLMGDLAKFAISEKASEGSKGETLAGLLPQSLGAYDYYSAPYALMALNATASNENLAQRESYVTYLLNTAGAWDTTFGVDMPAISASALAPYYGKEGYEAVTQKVDTVLTQLSQAQGTDGTYGNANTTGMVVTALSALGVDAHTDRRFIKNDRSAVEGLLTYALKDNSGFGYRGNVVRNQMATEQGFRALVAYARFKEGTGGYSIYAQSGKAPAVPTDPGITTTQPGTGGGDQPSGDMTVYFTLETNNATWIARHRVTVPKQTTVGEAFRQVLDGKPAFSYVNSGGYVSSITYSGTTLTEFEAGPNSGWKYRVNGTAPSDPMNEYALAAGDDLVWYYVTDYTTDTDRDESSFNKPQITTPELTGKGEDAAVEVKPSVTADKKGQATAQITEKEINSALATAKKGAAKTLVLAPQVKGTATAVTVELPTASAAALGKDGMTLRVETGLAGLTLSAEALAQLGAAGSKGVSVTAQAGENGTIRLNVQVGDTVADTLAGGMKVSLPAEKAGPGTVLMLVDDQGNESVVKLSAVVSGQLNALLAGSATVKLVDNAKDFSDLEPGHWAANAAAFATGRELLKGTGEGTFAPAASMTRASLMTILCRLDGGEEAQPGEGEVWYGPSQRWAVERGLSDGSNPEGEMTRQELAALLYRYAKVDGGEGDIVAPDAADIAPWAAEAMAWVVQSGILTGDQAGRLNPNGAASRGEVAVMLERFICQLVV